MVDSINGIGAPSKILPTRNNQSGKTDEKSTAAPAKTDEVNLSEEAVSLSEATQLASKTRSYLSENTSETLSNGKSFDELL